jgi:oligoendopeptidase F
MIFESRYYAHTETASELNKLPERSEISAEYQWRSEDIFKSDVDWEKTFSKIEKKIPQFSQYQGKLRDSASTLLACLKLRDYIKEELGRLFLYAGLKNDQDTRISQYQAYRDKATSLMVQINQATSFIQPEILSIPEDTLRSFLDDNSELSTYLHYFDDLLRTRQHVLPAEQEHLLAMTGEIAQGPYNIFSMFNNADIKFPTICDEQDRQIEVTKGRYNRLMESPDRRVRKEAFLAMYNTYGKWTNTLAATLSTAVKHNIFYARAKKYPTAIAAVLDENNIPPGVYQNVVNTVNRHLAPLHRYMKLRKKMLQLNELHPWDLLVPIISEVKFEMSYRAQPYFYSQYTTFVAEVASTLNEALLIDYLLKHTNEKQKKLYLLSQYVDQIRGTVYIQSLFAEFEKTIHDKAEAGEALTAETFSQFTRELYLRYFGPEFVMDEEYNINWCRIPHFYYNFYVYQYVTGFSAATTLSQKILAGDTAARDAYLRFLSRGSSDYSINLLKDAGVDMTSPEPIEATAKLMNRLLDEMEALV